MNFLEAQQQKTLDDACTPQELVDYYIASAPEGYAESPEPPFPRGHAMVEMNGSALYYKKYYGYRDMRADLARAALRTGRGCWRDIVYRLVPDLFPPLPELRPIRCNLRGHRRLVSLMFSADLVHMQIDGVWFDLDGIQALQLLEGYSAPKAVEMVIHWDLIDNEDQRRVRGTR